MATVAVLGAGVMGRGIATAYAQFGYDVFLYDTSSEALQAAQKQIQSDVTLMRQEGMLQASENVDTHSRLHYTTDLKSALANAWLVTESIPEIIEFKITLLRDVESIVSQDVIITSNTSSLALSDLVADMKYPERLLVTHFFNPAHLVPLVEIVSTNKTSKDVLQKVVETIRRLQKVPVLLRKDIAGFIGNRLQAALVREAFHLLESGVASAKDIDRALRFGPGFRWAFMGCFETVDYGGIDVWEHVCDNLFPTLSDSKVSPQTLHALYESGNLGTKTGNGLYDYTPETIVERIRERDRSFIQQLLMNAGRKY